PAAVGTRHLLGQDDGREVVATLSAVLRRVAQAEEAELAEPPHDRVGERRLLPLLEVGHDLPLQEAADVEAEVLVRVGEVRGVPIVWATQMPGTAGGRTALSLRPVRGGWAISANQSGTHRSSLGFGHQEAAQEDAEAQASQDAEEDPLAAPRPRLARA